MKCGHIKNKFKDREVTLTLGGAEIKGTLDKELEVTNKTLTQTELETANRQSAIGFLIFTLITGAACVVVSFLAIANIAAEFVK